MALRSKFRSQMRLWPFEYRDCYKEIAFSIEPAATARRRHQI